MKKKNQPDQLKSLRRETADKLRKTRQMMAQAEELTGLGSAEWDIKNDTWLLSDNWKRIHGVSDIHLTTEQLLPIAHPDDRSAINEAFARTLEKGEPYEIEHRIIRQDTGEIRHIFAKGIVVFDNAGKPASLVGAVQDITRHKQAEEALRLSEARFKSIIAVSNTGAWEFHKEKDYLWCSPEYFTMLGRDPADYTMDGSANLTESWINLLHPDDRDRASKHFADYLAGGSVGMYENYFRMRHRDGRWVWVWSRGQTLRNSNGMLTQRTVGTHIDITESKQAEQQLIAAKEKAEESEAKYRKLFENLRQERILLRTIIDSIPDAIYLKDMENRKVLANKADCINLGVEKEEDVIGKTDADFFSAEIVEKLLNDDKKVLEEGISVVNREECLTRPDMDKKWLLTSKLPLHNDKGEIVGLVGIGRDITERKQAEQQIIAAKEKAQESDRLKSAFLANMSHEIRTPMNGILGFAELLKEPLLTDEQQQKYIEIIEKSGERMLNIINDIVDISRIESGLMDVYLAKSNINKQLDYVYKFFKPQVEAKGMQLMLPDLLPADNATIVTDREKLFAVLTNLVKNAIKYSNEGTIGFGCYIAKTHGRASLHFFVKDTGIGIPKERQHAIFDRFVQADIEDREARQGAGLGLAISKAYVEMLGGEIWVESEEGTGSTFNFTIPFIKEHQEADSQKPVESVKIVQNMEMSLKILIVEDDELSAMLMEKHLRKAGKEILKAINGSEAVSTCKDHPDIDLVLMDVKMPGMDGEEATRQIRKFNKDVVIIAQTAKALIGDKQSMLDAGCNDYITKPINKDELYALIEKYFGE